MHTSSGFRFSVEGAALTLGQPASGLEASGCMPKLGKMLFGQYGRPEDADRGPEEAGIVEKTEGISNVTFPVLRLFRLELARKACTPCISAT